MPEFLQKNGKPVVEVESDSMTLIEMSPIERVRMIDTRLAELKKEIAKLGTERETLVEGCIEANFTDDGQWKLVPKDTTVRRIDPNLMKKLYPEQFNQVATVTLKDAELVLGKNHLEMVVVRDTRTRWVAEMPKERLYSMMRPEGVEQIE
jgi:hypothetical protein